MRDRFLPSDVWECVGLPKEACIAVTAASPQMQYFRHRLFSRIVPTVKDIGLWGPQVQEAFAAMGAIEFAQSDAVAMLDNDSRVADEFDARLRLRDAGVA